MSARTRLPPGRQPYDPLNGMRIGAIAGAALGAIAVVATGTGASWSIFVFGGIGGALGYWIEERHVHQRPPRP